jgi:hypothetical protein
MKLTTEQWAEIWTDAIDSGVLSKCRHCGRPKKLIGRDTYTINGLTVTAPRRRCFPCEPEGEKGE